MSENPQATPPAADIPAKFMNPDGSVNVNALAQSYRALETSYSSRPAPAPQPAPAPAPAPAAGPSFAEVEASATQELVAAGRISEQSYANFERLGISRQAVDFNVQARRQQDEALKSAVYGTAGGQQAFETMAAWARVNLQPHEQRSMDELLRHTDPELRKIGVQQIKSRYEAANGTQGNLLNNVPNAPQGMTGASSAQPFRSLKEYTDAIKDPRWGLMEGDRSKIDTGYRSEMAQRLLATHRAGVDLGLRVFDNGKRIL